MRERNREGETERGENERDRERTERREGREHFLVSP